MRDLPAAGATPALPSKKKKAGTIAPAFSKLASKHPLFHQAAAQHCCYVAAYGFIGYFPACLRNIFVLAC
jgi:hypothetical protein